jgi:hypothetical protein
MVIVTDKPYLISADGGDGLLDLPRENKRRGRNSWA